MLRNCEKIYPAQLPKAHGEVFTSCCLVNPKVQNSRYSVYYNM